MHDYDDELKVKSNNKITRIERERESPGTADDRSVGKMIIIIIDIIIIIITIILK